MKSLKRMTLFATVAVLAAAFAAPAQASEWAVNEEPLGEEPVAFTMEGPISESKWGMHDHNITVGPCNERMTGSIWNEGGEARGEISGYEIDLPCPILYQGQYQICTLESKSFNNEEEALPFGFDTSLTFGFEFGHSFSAGCSFGEGNTTSGGMKGTWQEDGEISLAGDIIVGSWDEAIISGEMEIVSPEAVTLVSSE